jgi:hypothetical protein
MKSLIHQPIMDLIQRQKANNVFCFVQLFFCIFIGACARTYSQNFTSGGTPSSQCTAWSSFVVGLTCSSYSSARIYGSNDPVGLTVTNSAVATGIASALRNSGSYTGTSNGYTWVVGPCGGGYEIRSTGVPCQSCTGYAISPCIGNNNWGGINGTTCGAGSQTMSLYFQ